MLVTMTNEIVNSQNSSQIEIRVIQVRGCHPWTVGMLYINADYLAVSEMIQARPQNIVDTSNTEKLFTKVYYERSYFQAVRIM